MDWINIEEQLPPDNDNYGGKEYLVTVVCDSWKKAETLVMRWETTTVRNKFVRRWRYLNSIIMSAWKVTHWMELPEPAIKGDNS